MIQRRKFLRQLSLAVPGALLLPSLVTACSKDIKFQTVNWNGTIIIIGAGASGIYSAYLLKKYAPKASIKLLEASGTYGGRIRELDGFADFKIELGAEEVHGKTSTWYQIVDSTNANLITSPRSETDFVMMDATLKSEDDAKSDPDYNKAQSAVNSCANYSGADIDCDSLARNAGVPNRTLHLVNALTGNEYGTSSNRLSAKGISQEDDLWSSGGQNYNVANRSYYSILQEKYGDVISEIIANTQIISIDYTMDQITLKDQNNNSFQCDKAIVTVPLTILQRGDITFNPVLPSEKLNAINNIGMGAGLKIILKFNNRFWDAETGSIYGNGIIPEYWYTAKGRGNDHVLTAFVMGEKAEILSAAGASALTSVLSDLDAMFGSSVATNSIVDHHICDWTKEPFIAGAYSFAKNGDIIAHRTTLSQDISQKIYFAGEATHTAGHNSTVHGAIETAEREVKKILDSL